MLIHHSHGAYEIVQQRVASALSSIEGESRIVTDTTVKSLLHDELQGYSVYAIRPGETSKDLNTFGQVLSWLAATKASRATTIVALGGGVVGDLAGFAAASYMRGVQFIQIPTTLLAMVDSSVGGKVGIDLPEGKNLAGAFKAPTKVSLPIELLAALPPTQFRNGMAEVLKYGFIMDERLSCELSANTLSAHSPNLADVVLRCISLKAQVVEDDEFETTGRRAILNYGHTVGHAIEYAMGYGTILHGEAIAIGMVVEARLGENLGITEPGTARQVARDLESYSLPTKLDASLNSETLLEAMYRDKKVESGRLAFSLLECRGRCKLVKDIESRAVLSALDTK